MRELLRAFAGDFSLRSPVADTLWPRGIFSSSSFLTTVFLALWFVKRCPVASTSVPRTIRFMMSLYQTAVFGLGFTARYSGPDIFRFAGR